MEEPERNAKKRERISFSRAEQLEVAEVEAEMERQNFERTEAALRARACCRLGSVTEEAWKV